jgi:hypothetical protein
MTMIFMGDFTVMCNNTPSTYNPQQAAEEMESVAKFAAHCLQNRTPLQPEFLGKCVQLLRDADDWLALHQTPFDLPPRETLLEAAETDEQLSPELMVEVLEYTVIEVLQISKLLELRGARLHGR